MRPRARRFESEIGSSRVKDLRRRDPAKASLKHRGDQPAERRMKRQQRVVDLGKIMAIPQRLEILAHHGLQRGTRPRNPSELGKRSMQRRKMMQHVDAGDRVHRARAERQSATRRTESSGQRFSARRFQPSPANDRSQSSRSRSPSAPRCSCRCRRRFQARIERPTPADLRPKRPQLRVRRTANCHRRRQPGRS